MINNYKITRGSLSDLEDICNLNYSIFKELYSEEPYNLEKYKKRLKNKDSLIYVVKKRKEIVGDSIALVENKNLYLWIIGVSKKHRGKGLASKILNLNEKFARKIGCDSITAKVYNISKEMMRLLLKRGYNVILIKKSVNSNYNSVYLSLNLK